MQISRFLTVFFTRDYSVPRLPVFLKLDRFTYRLPSNRILPSNHERNHQKTRNAIHFQSRKRILCFRNISVQRFPWIFYSNNSRCGRTFNRYKFNRSNATNYVSLWLLQRGQFVRCFVEFKYRRLYRGFYHEFCDWQRLYQRR